MDTELFLHFKDIIIIPIAEFSQIPDKNGQMSRRIKQDTMMAYIFNHLVEDNLQKLKWKKVEELAI